jgi:hypothetical protein
MEFGTGPKVEDAESASAWGLLAESISESRIEDVIAKASDDWGRRSGCPPIRFMRSAARFVAREESQAADRDSPKGDPCAICGRSGLICWMAPKEPVREAIAYARTGAAEREFWKPDFAWCIDKGPLGLMTPRVCRCEYGSRVDDFGSQYDPLAKFLLAFERRLMQEAGTLEIGTHGYKLGIRGLAAGTWPTALAEAGITCESFERGYLHWREEIAG